MNELCKNVFTIKLHSKGNLEILALQRSEVERNCSRKLESDIDFRVKNTELKGLSAIISCMTLVN